MLKFHELEVAWNDVQSREVCFLDHLADLPDLVIVTDCAVEGLVLTNVEFWLEAMESG